MGFFRDRRLPNGYPRLLMLSTDIKIERPPAELGPPGP
jgi:hypothetical protein